MSACPRRRSLLVTFALTGVFLVLVFLNKHPTLRQTNYADVIEKKSEDLKDENFIPQNQDGGSRVTNHLPYDEEGRKKEEEEEREDEEEEEYEGVREKTEGKVVLSEKEVDGDSLNDHQNPVMTFAHRVEVKNSSDAKQTTKMKNVNDAVVNENYSTTLNQNKKARKYLSNLQIQNLFLKYTKNTTKSSSKFLMPYEQIFDAFLKRARLRMKMMFANEPLDINFTPGEIVPSSKMRRILIVSSWRCGSTFLGDILKSYPGTFYSFEPLHIYLKNKHLEDGEDVPKSLKLITDIATCNLTPHDDYVKYMQQNYYLMEHNSQTWINCLPKKDLCFEPQFLSQVCQYFPLNVMKTVRLGLAPVTEILEDSTLDMKVIHLVRDPRGVLHSRMKLHWCTSKVCNDPATVCEDLLTDLKLSEEYAKKYPNRFLLVRYEDLSLEPEKITKEILHFVGLHYHEKVERFIREHTKLSVKKKKPVGTYTTFRDSQTTPFAWRDFLSFDKVDYVQRHCKEPIRMLGYTSFSSPEEYNDKTIPVLSTS